MTDNCFKFNIWYEVLFNKFLATILMGMLVATAQAPNSDLIF